MLTLYVDAKAEPVHVMSEEERERALVEAVRRAEPAARKDLYTRYAGMLTAVCSRYVVNREDLRDVLQDSFIKIFTSFGSFTYRGKGSLQAWMSRIVVNEALKYIRQNEQPGWMSTMEELPDRPEEEDPDLDRIAPGVLADMIRRLPSGYRTVLNLYVFEEKSHKEIAALLGIGENSSASQLSRAKSLLAKWIKEYRRTL